MSNSRKKDTAVPMGWNVQTCHPKILPLILLNLLILGLEPVILCSDQTKTDKKLDKTRHTFKSFEPFSYVSIIQSSDPSRMDLYAAEISFADKLTCNDMEMSVRA